MSFDEIFDLTAGVYFIFYNMDRAVTAHGEIPYVRDMLQNIGKRNDGDGQILKKKKGLTT